MLTALLRIRKDLQLLSALLRHHGSAFVDLTNHGWKKIFFFFNSESCKKANLEFSLPAAVDVVLTTTYIHLHCIGCVMSRLEMI